MRYREGGARHAAVRDAVDEFLLDRDVIDQEHRRKREEELDGPQYRAGPAPAVDGRVNNLQDDQDRAAWNNEFGDKADNDDDDYRYRRQDDSDVTSNDDYSDEGSECSDDYGFRRL